MDFKEGDIVVQLLNSRVKRVFQVDKLVHRINSSYAISLRGSIAEFIRSESSRNLWTRTVITVEYVEVIPKSLSLLWREDYELLYALEESFLLESYLSYKMV